MTLRNVIGNSGKHIAEQCPLNESSNKDDLLQKGITRKSKCIYTQNSI